MSSESTPKPTRVIGRGRYLEVVDEGGWEYMRRHAASGVAVILATTDDQKLVLVEQRRIPVHCRVIELPAGLVGDVSESANESLQDGAVRELEEETGFRAAHWERLVDGPSSVGASSELVTFFRATGLTRVAAGGGDASENIIVHIVALGEVAAFLAAKRSAGLLIDPKVLAGLYLLSTEPAPPALPSASASPPTPARPFNVRLNEMQGPLPFVPRIAADGTAVWEYTVTPEHYNPYGVLHGGVVMALMDSAMGHAVAAQVHAAARFNAAAQMNVNFLSPVRSGVLRARAHVVKVGKRLAVVEAIAEADDGTAVATATATHSLLP